MVNDAYQPIACADYDTYEIAIMQGRPLMMKWETDSGDTIEQSVKPIKLEINDGAEYLNIEFKGLKSSKIRLDKILHAEIIKT